MAGEFSARGQALVERIAGFDTTLGIRFESASELGVCASLEVRPHHLQLHGFVHGGVHCALVETTCSVGASLCAPEETAMVGLENHTSLLRPVRGGTLKVAAAPLSVGRTTQLWGAEVRDEAGRLVARGQLRLLAMSPPPR